jgi:hypothetical protein
MFAVTLVCTTVPCSGLLQLTQYFRDRAVLEVRQARVAVEVECAIAFALEDKIAVRPFHTTTRAHTAAIPTHNTFSRGLVDVRFVACNRSASNS